MISSNIQSNWKQRFLPFWISQLLSVLGSSLVQFVLIWWLVREEGSATIIATSAIFAMVPEIIIQPFAGAIVDRSNRKLVIFISDFVIALVTLGLGLLFYFDCVEVWLIFGAMFLRAIGSAFHYPASQASVSMLVPKDSLSRIAGLDQAFRGLISIISAPLGAMALSLLDVEGALFIDAITASIAIVIILFTPLPKQQKLKKQSRGWIGTVVRDFAEGFSYLFHWRALLILTGIGLVFKFALTPALSLIPLLVLERLGGNAAQFSLVEIISGIGLILGGIVLGMWGGFDKKVKTIFLGLTGVGMGVLLIGLIPKGGLLWIFPSIFLVGFMVPLANGPINALLQAEVEQEYQGRVISLFGSVINLSGPIGLAISGPVADKFGIQIWFILAAVLVFASIAYGFCNKQLMSLEIV